MSSHLNRPIVRLNEDGQRSFATPGACLHRLELEVYTFEDQVRLELHEWRPGQAIDGSLVWQHRSRERTTEPLASLVSTRALARSSEWLAKEGWPGVVF